MTELESAADRRHRIECAQRNKGRIQHDPHRRGNLFARIMTDNILFDYRVIDRDQADKDCDLSRRTSVHHIIRDCLSLQGLSSEGTNAERAMRAFQMDNGPNAFTRSYSRDSFPAILDNIGSKAMSLGFDRAPEVWPFIVRQTTTKDFKPFTRVTAPEYPSPEKVIENGQITRPQLGDDSKETASIGAYPFLVSLSRQAVINDDLNALTVTAEAAGRAASRLNGDLVFAVLTDNNAMADSVTLFHATHGNVGTPSAPSITALNEIRNLMGLQVGSSGEVLNIRLAIVVGAPNMESTLTTIRDASSSLQPDPLTPGYQAGYVSVVTDGRLTGTAWYAIGDPRIHSGIDLVALEGSERPLLERQTVFVSDAIEWKVLHDAVALPVDYRTLVYNAGA
jgi:hypothetical protein